MIGLQYHNKEFTTVKKYRMMNLFFLCVLLLSACGTAPDQHSPEDITLRVPFTIWPGNYPIAIAQEQGFFEKHGVKVEIVYTESYPQTYIDYASGKNNAIPISIGDLLPLLEKRPSVVVMLTDDSRGADHLLVSDDIQSVADLRGKRIGVNQGTYGDYWLRELLRANGMSITDVQWVNVVVENTLDEFPQSVDAVHSYDPYTTDALDNGGHILLTSEDTPHWQILSTFVFPTDIVEEHPEAVRGFVAAFFEGVEWFYSHSDEEVVSLVAKVLDVPVEYVWLGGDYVMTLEDNKMLMKPGTDFNSLYFTTNEYMKFLSETGRLNTAPDVDELIDPSFLP
jgi:NitT/TauT family transport system substrate-binding protein